MSSGRTSARRLGGALAPSCVVLLACLLAACHSAVASASKNLIVYEGATGGVGGETTNIYTVDVSNGAIRQLTNGVNFDGQPAWSPDRRRIIFSSRRDGQTRGDIYTMNIDGGDVRRLTDTDGGEISAKYSPDRELISYAREDDDGWKIWVMRADGSDQHIVAGKYEFAEFPSWTRDGASIYYSAMGEQDEGDTSGEYGRAHIYSVDVATGDVRTRIATAGPDVCPHFSRDGSRLTYAAPGEGDEPDIFAHDMASQDTSGTTDVALTREPARDDYGNPSPDDRRMVFLSDRSGNPELYLMNSDGSGVERLTTTPDVKENVPDW